MMAAKLMGVEFRVSGADCESGSCVEFCFVIFFFWHGHRHTFQTGYYTLRTKTIAPIKKNLS